MALSNLQTRQERTGTLSRPMENVIVWTFLLPLFAFVRVTTTGNVPRTLKSLYGVIPVPLDQFTSVTYLRRGVLRPHDPKRFGRANNEAYGLGNFEPKLCQ